MADDFIEQKNGKINATPTHVKLTFELINYVNCSAQKYIDGNVYLSRRLLYCTVHIFL